MSKLAANSEDNNQDEVCIRSFPNFAYHLIYFNKFAAFIVLIKLGSTYEGFINCISFFKYKIRSLQCSFSSRVRRAANK